VATLFQVARRRVVDRVIAPPLRVGRQRQHPGDEPDDVIRAARLEERAVPAVVHDDEGADQEPGGDDREDQGQQVAHLHREVHRDERQRQRA
jgi:hypothetical protein